MHIEVVIKGYPQYWKPFLHPQPEDAPYGGDRDSLITHGGSNTKYTKVTAHS
jgi:hypothetical protein